MSDLEQVLVAGERVEGHTPGAALVVKVCHSSFHRHLSVSNCTHHHDTAREVTHAEIDTPESCRERSRDEEIDGQGDR